MTGFHVPLELDSSDDGSSVSGRSSSVGAGGHNIEDIVQEEPMYYVLGQFLTSSTTGKNIADVLTDLCEEIRALRMAVAGGAVAVVGGAVGGGAAADA